MLEHDDNSESFWEAKIDEHDLPQSYSLEVREEEDMRYLHIDVDSDTEVMDDVDRLGVELTAEEDYDLVATAMSNYGEEYIISIKTM